MSAFERTLVRVALILDDSFEGWAVPTVEFPILWVRVVGSIRGRESELREREGHLLGHAEVPEVHWFEGGEKPILDELNDVVELIAIHHSEYETDKPWDEIVVFGLRDPEPVLRGLHEALGYPVDIARRAIINA